MRVQETHHDNETCRRLMTAAGEEFAQHGFAGARVRSIVDAARVNLASVNYYFGGKEGLYRATVGFLAGQAMTGFAERRGQTPEKRLHRIVYAFLAGLSAAAAAPPLGRILAHEAMHPTPQMERLVEDMARPQLERLRAAVRELAGPAVPDREVTLAALAVAGHCVMYLFGRNAIDRVFPGMLAGRHSIGRLARQVTDFALAGIARQRAIHAPGAPKGQVANPPTAARRVAKKGGFSGH
jgi:AcrR family transcriptional regulator